MIRWTIKKNPFGWIVRRWDTWPHRPEARNLHVTWTSEPFDTFEDVLNWWKMVDCDFFQKGYCHCRSECAN
ncbi:hypothetical protein HOT82_gp007 [Gordonia phage Ronaldo]|uniref:Uncharacterized protein n=3 Tax=Ronaldovirus ronaldo TaxID=2734270 RepID=A0A6B9L8G1_9CAUD|nr:hypothetical protein HOT82_gp007 [Gordonia phage Ronaldo]AXN53570.1 hypothetical protein SEA_RONALDO_7 [Gordonia phage Ronaldo]QDH48347.1 hypothetical protein SEA_ZIKO_8 [Gordonia phage Ziko]QHB38126.1 hypothetical protein SEA_VOLT_7 [Gordonia phage Volt]